ncbi:hypothetical protein [Paenibacillus xylanexedens]|uniref:MFS transporter n=1 Tax=Paenibacillus xylanexedens TaxID=528191 RepID=A0ABS4RW76_PAEXY|nr:hypothetical protein [Paenibacillus xylanexedens]MBP2247162.1 hypothetical protein [Paenibacillus xylanexedens]
MHTIDMILLTLYFIGAICGVYNLIKHAPYFKERFKSGVVSAFMLAMLFFLGAYTFKMVIAIWIRLSTSLTGRGAVLEAIQSYAWTIAMFGTTAGLVILSILTYTKRYDLFVYLRKIDKKGEPDNVDSGTSES